MNNFERISTAIQGALQGELPTWRRPWRTLRESGAVTIPVNASSGRAYRGVNVCILWARQDADMRYLTYRQALEAGGHVRKGEKGTQIVFWQKSSRKVRDEKGEEELRDSLLMRVYSVFNVSQCEGLKLPVRETVAPQPTPKTMAELYAKLGTRVEHGGDRAFFAPGPDFIGMPLPEAFTSADAYAATALHELVHWTGHEKRLAREFGKRFGDRAYAAEELVAEIGAAFLCAALGIDSALEHHASYVQHWNQMLRDDSRAIITAASRAQAAADYLLGRIQHEPAAEEFDDQVEELACAA